MEIVEIASTFPTDVTSKGMVFWMTLATVTLVGGRLGGAACSFAQPELSAAKATKQIAWRMQSTHLLAPDLLWDKVIN
jgi:hypothetical protein